MKKAAKSITLDADLIDELQMLAKYEGCSLSQLINLVMARYAERNKEKIEKIRRTME